jgi:hypothetical protein
MATMLLGNGKGWHDDGNDDDVKPLLLLLETAWLSVGGLLLLLETSLAFAYRFQGNSGCRSTGLAEHCLGCLCTRLGHECTTLEDQCRKRREVTTLISQPSFSIERRRCDVGHCGGVSTVDEKGRLMV